ncbi:MAG: O-antigen ligase family protein [Bacteroidia bacterium]
MPSFNQYIRKALPSQAPRPWLLAGMAALILLSALVSIKFSQPLIWVLPLGAIGLMAAVWDYRPLWFMMIAAIPASLHLEFGPLALDIPSEPLMVFFLGVLVINLVSGRQFGKKDSLFPFHILVIALLFWTCFTALLSDYPMRSIKYVLSRLWYMAAFVFVAEKILQNPKILLRMGWCFVISLAIFSFITTLRHIPSGFSFEGSHFAPGLFFTNHVIYGAAVVLGMPWAWLLWKESAPNSMARKVAFGAMGIIMLGVILCYARGAWVSFIALPVLVVIISRKALVPALTIGIILLAFGLGWLAQGNNYYRFAPDYKETIFHEGDLGGHLNATFQGKELSGMERFYRWVAAFRMIEARPVAGFGPSTFNQNYRKYANDAFRTYVSDNPEQSTTHNYYLMTFAEQGFVGGLLFIGMCLYMFTKGGRLALEARVRLHRRLALVATLSLSVIMLHSLLNELIEVDKVGAMFWINLLTIHLVDKWERKVS